MESVLIVAAEASSSLYAQRLLEFWQKSNQDVVAFGVGSRSMEALGFACIGRSEEMAVVGLQEVLKHLPLIRKVYHQILEEVESRQPSFALLLDYPDFNLRLAKDLKRRGIRVIYYISPQVWAWRTRRVNLIRRVVDHMLVLFPFEETFYRQHGVKVDFVGHPALDELPSAVSSESERNRSRGRYGLGENDLVLGLMPGSRHSELRHHLAVQIETAEILVRQDSRVRPVLMIAPTLERQEVVDLVGEISFPLQIIKEPPFEMIGVADVVLCASGTATLMVGLMEKPMVIMYRMNRLTAWFAKRMVTKTPFFGMVNLIMNRRIVPELFQEQATPRSLAAELSKFLFDPSERHRLAIEMRELKDRLGQRGATKVVASCLSGYFGKPKKMMSDNATIAPGP